MEALKLLFEVFMCVCIAYVVVGTLDKGCDMVKKFINNKRK